MTFPHFLWKNASWLRPLLLALGYDFDPAHRQPVPEPPAPEPTPEPPSDETQVCEVLELDYKNLAHLSNGFIWKPESDGNGNLAVVMPRRLTGRLMTASLPGSTRPVEEKPFDDCRQVFRFPHPGAHWKGTTLLSVKTIDGQVLTYTIKDGDRRWENVIPVVS